MDCNTLISRLGLTKLIAEILAVISLLLGTVSYFESDWKRKGLHSVCRECALSHNNDPFLDEYNCPRLRLETFHVVVIITSFALSAVITLAALIKPKQLNKIPLQLMDFAFHMSFGGIIMLSGCTLIYSAAKIDQVLESPEWNSCNPMHEADQLLTGGKIVAGIIALKVGVLYEVVAYLALQRMKTGEENYLIME